MASGNYQFDIPDRGKSIIKVIGVGGGGSNAVTHMYNQGIKGVEFIICNTDAQALNSSPVPGKLQIGVNLTEGLGAGANPDRGRSAALESKEDIRDLLGHDTKMLFITAGMGGGTGTGAAPVIAGIAKELGILTVGIVTAPFMFEGKKKILQAEAGIGELKDNCDTVVVILNDKLRDIYGDLSIRQAFSQADNVLTTAAKSIAEIITVTSDVNVDFEDVKTVMKNSGAAVMGAAVASGEGRARKAVEQALSSPLLNNTDIFGAKKILLSVLFGDQQELTMDELVQITDYIEEKAGDEAEVIFGQGLDTTLGDAVSVTVIATGFDHSEEYKKPVIHHLEKSPGSAQTSLFDQSAPRSAEAKQEEPMLKQESTATYTFTTVEALKTEHVQQPVQARTLSAAVPYTGPTISRRAAKEGVEYKKEVLSERARYRIEKLKSLSGSHELRQEELKYKLDVPAYLRKNVDLDNVAHSSSEDISRYTLNEEGEILGNNKFLHDNVD